MKWEMIVAYGKYDRAIGQDGALPWGNTLTQDLRRFRQLTLGKSVIMGRRTYESIGRALPGRDNLVVTRHPEHLPDQVIAVHGLEEACARSLRQPIVIGGGQLYAEALSHTDTIYATEIDGHFPNADTHFPELPSDPHFIEAFDARQRIAPDVIGGYAYEFTIFTAHLKNKLKIASYV